MDTHGSANNRSDGDIIITIYLLYKNRLSKNIRTYYDLNTNVIILNT